MTGFIGLTLLIISWCFYRQPYKFLTINAFACIFLMAEAFQHSSIYLLLANFIILLIAVYQLGNKLKKKI